MNELVAVPLTSRRAEIALWSGAGIAALTMFAVSAAVGASAYGTHVAFALLVAFVQAAAIGAAVRWPVLGAFVAVLGVVGEALALPLVDGTAWPVSVPGIIALTFALAVIGIRGAWRSGVFAWLAANTAAVVIGAVRFTALGSPSENAPAMIATLIVCVTVSLPVLVAALLLRSFADVSRELLREREVSAAQLARREVVEERTRIARDLHDVVAHSLSAIQVQAASAKYRLADLDVAAADEFDTLAATARAGTEEMRRLLGALRDERQDDATEPQPGIAQIQPLVDGAAHDGTIECTIDVPDPDAIPGTVALTAYRIVQESLSNLTRHAPGAAAIVRVEHAANLLLVAVQNGAPGTAVTPGPAGHGLKGMRERTALIGGTVTIAPTPDGGFLVSASLPLEVPE